MTNARERVCLTLFVPGAPSTPSGWKKALAVKVPFSFETEHVPNPHDGSFGEAFSFGTCSRTEQAAIDQAGSAVVLSISIELNREPEALAKLLRSLEDAGALAVRVEESKVGYPIARWLELLESGNPWGLYRLAVALLVNEGEASTCGMQAFSLPDAQVALDATIDANAANELLGSLNVYQLAESPLLLSGHTFSPDAATARRELRRWPDTKYPSDSPCHNPFGSWRLGLAGKKPSPPSEPALVHVPALVVLLLAAEKDKGTPLTKAEVEGITEKGACIAMKHEDARELERSRGYADLDPELAWEQWRAMRAQG